MSGFNINTGYFMHSTPKYNKEHAEEISEYNADYYEHNKEKWKDNESSDEDGKKKKETKTDEEKAKDKVAATLKKINGGSKKGGSPTGKKSSSKTSSKSKKEETDEEKEEEEAKESEEKKKNSEAAEKYSKTMEANAKYIEEHRKGVKKTKPKTIKHSAVYVGINSQPYFQHHGRLGMKWGKRNGPPYPLDYSKLSEEERAKDKDRVKAEGDIESVSYKKNRSYFSDAEINEVINRYNLNTRINQLAADSARMKAGKSKTDQMIEKMSKVAEVGNKLANGLQAGSNVYNNVAKIMNAFGDSDLPIIGEKKDKGKISFRGDIDDILKNVDRYSDQQLADIQKRQENINKLIGSKKLVDQNKKDGKEEQQKEQQKTQQQQLQKIQQQQKAQQQQAQPKSQPQVQQQPAKQQTQQTQSGSSILANAQKVKDEYTKAIKERNEAEANFRKDSSDLNYKIAAVKDAKLEVATKKMNEAKAQENKYLNEYGKPENYSAVQRMLYKSRYEKAVERDKEQKAFAEQQKIARLEAEEKELEERVKRGQQWIEYYI